jgi:uncharacterized membrane protein
MELLALIATVAAIIAWVIASRATGRLDELEARQRDINSRLLEQQEKLLMRVQHLEAGAPPAVRTTGPVPTAAKQMDEAPSSKNEAFSEANRASALARLKAMGMVDAPTAPVSIPTNVERPVGPPPLPRAALAQTTAPALHAQPPAEKPAQREAASPLSLEQFLGAKLFAWLGGVALFLGVVFFVKYAFDHNLISPALRIAIGFVMGASLVGAGLKLHVSERYRVLAQTLAATGVLVLYGVTFAAHRLYQIPIFDSSITTFAMMSLITALAFWMAVKMDAQVVAALGMLGGFLTPPICSTEQDNAFGLFSFVALLDLGVLAVALRKRWFHHVPFAAVGTALMQSAWCGDFFFGEHYDVGAKTWVVIAVFAGFAWLFSACAAWCRRRTNDAVAVTWSALGLCAVAWIAAFSLLCVAAVAERMIVLYAFVFLVNGAVAWNVWQDKRFAIIAGLSGLATFVHIAIWTVAYLKEDTLPHALGLYVLFGIAHTAFAVQMQRKQSTSIGAAWMPVVALLLAMLPLITLRSVPFIVWPAMLLINALVLTAAILMRRTFTVLASMVLTLFSMMIWLVKPGNTCELGLFLGVLGVFSMAFVIGTLFLAKRMPDAHDHPLLGMLPALAALMPFALIAMATLHLHVTDPTMIFSFTLGLCVFLLEFARRTKLEALTIIAALCAFVVKGVWHIAHFDASQPMPAFLWYLGFLAVFTIYPLLCKRVWETNTLPWIGSALTSVGAFALVHQVVRHSWSWIEPGVAPAVFAFVPLGSLLWVLRRHASNQPERLTQLAWFGGVTLFFVTLIFPLQFDRESLSIAWALEGAALLWLFLRVPHNGLRGVAAALLATSFVRLALNPAVMEYHERSGTPVWNWFLYTYGLVAVAMFAAAWFARPPRDRLVGISLPAMCYTMAGVLLFLLLNIEIADAFTVAGQRFITFQFSGNLARDMTYTIAWSLFALGLMLLGFRFSTKTTRIAGIGLLGVALLKLFLHDLASVSGIYRIGALMVVAVIAFAASFLYQRFAERTR